MSQTRVFFRWAVFARGGKDFSRCVSEIVKEISEMRVMNDT